MDNVMDSVIGYVCSVGLVVISVLLATGVL